MGAFGLVIELGLERRLLVVIDMEIMLVAQVLGLRSLAIQLKVLGGGHPHIATSYFHLDLLCNIPIFLQFGRDALDGRFKTSHKSDLEKELTDKMASKTSNATAYTVDLCSWYIGSIGCMVELFDRMLLGRGVGCSYVCLLHCRGGL